MGVSDQALSAVCFVKPIADVELDKLDWPMDWIGKKDFLEYLI